MSHGYGYTPPLPFYKRRPLFVFILTMHILGFTLWGGYNYLNKKGVFSGPQLGLIRIEGFIADAEKISAWAADLQRNPKVAGVLVRIDSPGGAVAPSQEMHAAVERLAKVKPVVVSMGTVAASGGYYVAVAGQEIFASPSTLTGSIGVRMQLANVQTLMERLGVTSESLATGKFKTTGSPLQPLTEEEKTYLNTLMADMQDEFVRAVAAGRKLPLEQVTALADGRVFTGRQALEAKLIDSLGDREAALNRLAALCNLPTASGKLLESPKKDSPWWKELLTSMLGLGEVRSLAEPRYMFYY